MAERQRGMGRGLAAILSVAPRDEPEELRQHPARADLAQPAPAPPPLRRGAAARAGRVDQGCAGCSSRCWCARSPGGTYELIAGERRWRAAQLAELDEIPAIVRHHDDAASLEVALIENMAREDLNPVEEARACAALTEELGLSREEVGARVGRSRVAVSNLIRLLDLPDEALVLIERGELSEGHGRALLTAADHDERRRLARAAVDGRWSVRELEDRARRSQRLRADTRRRASRAVARSTPTRRRPSSRSATPSASALGREVDVTPTAAGGYRVHLSFGSLDEALDLARRLSSDGS